LKRGEKEKTFKVPLFKGDLGGSTSRKEKTFKVPLFKGDLGGSSNSPFPITHYQNKNDDSKFKPINCNLSRTNLVRIFPRNGKSHLGRMSRIF
jgi:hypothetical protein